MTLRSNINQVPKILQRMLYPVVSLLLGQHLNWIGCPHLREDLLKDATLQPILQQCLNTGSSDNKYSCTNDLLLWRNRLVVPQHSGIIPLILKEYHDTMVGGHSGIAKTAKRICSQFYWPNMHKQIRHYVLNCTICQQAKTTNTLPA
ncbi:hypothetical protein VIGAN_07174000, partial [Vigna angularis var. angularis]